MVAGGRWLGDGSRGGNRSVDDPRWMPAEVGGWGGVVGNNGGGHVLKPRTGWGLAEVLKLSRGIQLWPSRLPYSDVNINLEFLLLRLGSFDEALLLFPD